MNLKQEQKADKYGAILASLAGFEVDLLAGKEEFINQWARATSFRQDRFHPVIEQRQQAIRETLQDAYDSSWAFFLGVRMIYIGRYEEAIQALREFIAVYPGKEVFNNLGVAYHLWYQRLNPTPSLYKHSLTIAPHTQTSALNQSADIHGTGQEQNPAVYLYQAIACYHQAEVRDPNDPDTLHNLACAYTDLDKDLNKALHYADRAILLDTNFVQAYNTRGIILLLLHQHQEALQAFTRALTHTKYSDPLYNLAAYYASQGDKGRSRDYLNRYLALDSKSTWAKQAALLISGDQKGKKTKDALKEPPGLADAYSLDQLEGRRLDAHELDFAPWEIIPKYPRAQANYQNPQSEPLGYRVFSLINPPRIIVTFLGPKAILMETGPGYTSSTARGIRIADPMEKLYVPEAYGRPPLTFWGIGYQVLVYPPEGIAFEIEKGRVRSWYLFRPY